MPMPKAMVATITTPGSVMKRFWLASRASLRHAGMIGQRAHAVLLQERRRLFGLLARQAIDDAAAPGMALDEIQQLALAVALAPRR